jgi:hypothetical protein
MMDMDEPAAPELGELPVESVAEPDVVDEEEEEAEQEKTITIIALDLIALQDSLDDMQFKIANIERDARQTQCDVEERFEA